MPNKQVLVVEDGLLALRVYTRVLTRAGFGVLPAGGAEDALGLLRTNEPGLALVDVLMPGMDGFELCRRIRGSSATEVFLMTAMCTSPDHRLRAYEVGAAHFFVKPDSPYGVVDEVRRFYEEPRPLLQCGCQAPDSTAAAAPPAPDPVLIVEDDDQAAGVVGVSLEAAGFLPYRAATGKAGLLLAFKLQPRAIVLDVGLPDVDGFQVLEALKKSPRASHIPVVALSGSSGPEQQERFRNGGAVQYLVKGVNDLGFIPVLLRRLCEAGGEGGPPRVAAGPFDLDGPSRTALVFGEPVTNLLPMEFDLLMYLARRSPRVVPWDKLVRQFWEVPAGSARISAATHKLAVLYQSLKDKLPARAAACIAVRHRRGLQLDPSKALPS